MKCIHNAFHFRHQCISRSDWKWQSASLTPTCNIRIFTKLSTYVMTIALRPLNSTNGIYPGLICSKFNLKRIHLERGPAWRINSLAFSNEMYNITSDDYIWKFWLVVAGILSMPTRSRYILISVIGKSFLTIIFFLAKKRNCIQFPNQANCTMTNYRTLKCF